jgi:hypothetical protein
MKAAKHLRACHPQKRAALIDSPDVEGLVRRCHRSGKLDWRERELLRRFAKLKSPGDSAWRIFWGVCRKCGVEE